MKTPMALSVTSSQREQTSLRSQAPRLPRSNVCSTRDLENPSASVHLKRFSTPSLTLKFLCAGKLNPRFQCGLFFFGNFFFRFRESEGSEAPHHALRIAPLDRSYPLPREHSEAAPLARASFRTFTVARCADSLRVGRRSDSIIGIMRIGVHQRIDCGSVASVVDEQLSAVKSCTQLARAAITSENLVNSG